MTKKFQELGSTGNRSGMGRKKLISARVLAQLSRLELKQRAAKKNAVMRLVNKKKRKI